MLPRISLRTPFGDDQPRVRRQCIRSRFCHIIRFIKCQSRGIGGGGGGGFFRKGDGGQGGEDPRFWWLLPPGIVVSVAVVATQLKSSKHLKHSVSSEQLPASVIVPALNESKGIADTVAYLWSLEPPPMEVIVVDGGSTDATFALARRAGARVFRCGKGRAQQMNKGANSSKGAILLFVHADTRPPRNAVALARSTLSDPKTVLGGFVTSIEHEGRVLWFSTLHQFISTYYAPALFSPLGFFRGLKCIFGDQSLFCRAEDFRRVDGFNEELPIMEDADLCVRMHRHGLGNGRRGREVQVAAINRTSGRRIGPWGNWKSTMIQYQIALAWWRGATGSELWELYNERYTDAFR